MRADNNNVFSSTTAINIKTETLWIWEKNVNFKAGVVTELNIH